MNDPPPIPSRMADCPSLGTPELFLLQTSITGLGGLATSFTAVSRNCYKSGPQLVRSPGLSVSFIDGASEGYSLVHASRAFLFRLEPDKSVTLQAQLRRMLVSAILDGQILPGAPLPSCRSLAQSLKVARNTVVLAYQDLVEEGFLIARERSGFFVNPEILTGRAKGAAPEAKSFEPAPACSGTS
jgi:DNA-binding transcriptional regulator YhcF (GntR family)